METNEGHIKILDELIYDVFKDDRNGAVIGQMQNAFRKVASAAMGHGFESGYQIGYNSGFKQGASTGRQNAIDDIRRQL
jgi:hypothetical protein